ncbi:hypothetical protein KP509_18G009100 [Ceratopteris richardii]|uniref:Mechanosensitive ion channel protein n=1 Tax=Ceratopteris richardii TaxID=49495 RepID=A0A8T2SRT8_CERRI|nr:hypothetical protein KP509_18G009100 [Ceratopteris richardii]
MESTENLDEKKDALNKNSEEATLQKGENGSDRFKGFETWFEESNAPLASYKADSSEIDSGTNPAHSFQPCSTGSESSAKEYVPAMAIPPSISTNITQGATSKKTPGLPDLVLPATPNLRSPRNEGDLVANSPKSTSSSDSEVDEEVSPAMRPLLRRMSIPAYARLKTRLQDPRPVTSAVKNQLTDCSPSLLQRRASAIAAIEEEDARIGDLPSNSTTTEGNETLPPDQVASRRDSLKNVPSLPPEEEPDPLDDDIVPASKKRKTQDSKWIIFVQWIALVLLVTLLICTVEIRALHKEFLGLDVWRWLALAVVIMCGHLISGFFMKLLEMLIEKHYVLKKRVLYFVYGLRRAVKNCLWLALVIAVWESIFGGLEHTTSVKILTKTLWCLFTAAVSWMVKVLAVKVAANSFHRKAYFDRIQECVFNQYLLEVLSAPPSMAGITDAGSRQDDFSKLSKSQAQEQNAQKFTTLTQRTRRVSKQVSIDAPAYTTVEVEDYPASPLSAPDTPGRQKKTQVPLIARSPIPIGQEKLQELTSDTVSVWTLRRLMKLIRKTNIATYSSIISAEKDEGEISSEAQAKAAAKKIFYNMTRPGQKTLKMKDFLYFLHEEQALRAFSLFEVTESGEITKKSLTKWVVGAYKERRALALTLNDNKTVVAKLHKVLDTVLMLTLLIVFFLIFGVETSKLLVFFSSVFIPSVFVFGNSARTTFESLIFLFVTHPFDVGDRVVVEGQTMLVEEMNVLNTVFLGPTNEKIYFPNSLLSLKVISNYYRSPDQGDAVDFQVSMSTPLEKLGLLKERMQHYFDSLPQFYYPEFRIICDKIHDSNKMNLNIWLRHRLNYQDLGERFQRRSNLLMYLKEQLEDLEVGYHLPGQTITVTGFPFHAPSSKQ